MTALYGSILLVGFLALLIWVAATAVAGSVDGWSHVDPEHRFGAKGRLTLAGCIGFGMAGISVLYTTLPEWLSLVAAVVGAAALIAIASRVGPPASE